MIDICFKSLHPRVVLTTSITSNTTTTITIMGGGVLMTQIFRDQQRERERERSGDLSWSERNLTAKVIVSHLGTIAE